MAQQKPQTILRKILTVVGCVIAAGILIYIFGIRTWQEHVQRQNFAKAEVKLDELEKQIEAKVGKPDQMKKEKSCDYASREFGKGPRGCGIRIHLLFTHADLQNSNAKMNTLIGLSGTDLHYYLGETDRNGQPYPKSFTQYTGTGPSQEFLQNLNVGFGDIKCTMDYIYPVIAVFDKDFSNLGSENLQINLSCNGSALDEYFPLKD